MGEEYIWVAMHLGAAWLAGSLIGLERTFHGRPAGFRTHALVCMASALLMLLTTQQWERLGVVPIEMIRADPMRIAQGITTGIGFLGAGVIFKEGLTVRGLTTAASLWITSALGILFGVGLFYPAVLTTGVTLATLAVFNWIEYRMPSQFYAHHHLRFPRDRVPPATDVRRLITEHGFALSHMSYRLEESGTLFEYRMVIRTLNKTNLERLATTLLSLDNVVEFRISPSGD